MLQIEHGTMRSEFESEEFSETRMQSAGHAPLHSIVILGVRVDKIHVNELSSSVVDMITSGNLHRIVPVNPEMIMTARNNMEFRSVLNGSSLTLPDGIGVVMASRLYGSPIHERVAGIDAMVRLAALAEEKQYRLYLLGAATGVAERAVQNLKSLFPRLLIAGTYSGSPRSEDELEIRHRINEAHPDILFIAYGAPKQELWLARNHQYLRVPVAMCVGGAFDFLAGVTTRAPQFVQSAGLEWLFRLMKEPYRWRRMLALPRFTIAVVLDALFHA